MMFVAESTSVSKVSIQLSSRGKAALVSAQWVKEDPRFSDLLVRTSSSFEGHAFPRLRLRYKPSLVQVEGGTQHLPVTDHRFYRWGANIRPAFWLLGVAVCPGLKDAGLQGLGRRTRCRCLPEMPTEGDYRPFESSTSPDGASSEGEANVESTSDQPFFQDVRIGLNLPRRRMLVEFTCNKCNSRTQRVINPEAYRRGTVFVQCGGCEVYHQLVDNLNLIQEFDFREDEGLI